MMNKTGTQRFNKMPDDGDPWTPNNLLEPGAKENVLIAFKNASNHYTLYYAIKISDSLCYGDTVFNL